MLDKDVGQFSGQRIQLSIGNPIAGRSDQRRLGVETFERTSGQSPQLTHRDLFFTFDELGNQVQ